MPRYIDADELILKCQAIISDKWNEQAAPASWANAYADFIDDIENAPTVDAEPVRHGRWINVIGDDYKCSICKAAIWARKANPISEYKYCWSCGAKMYGGENK
jgi:hypothetical protein